MEQERDDWALPDPAALSNPDHAEESRADDEGPSEASRILEDHRDELMAKHGVTMVGETRDAAGRPAIMIGVKTAADLRGLPSGVEGVPVVSVVTGEIDALRSG